MDITKSSSSPIGPTPEKAGADNVQSDTKLQAPASMGILQQGTDQLEVAPKGSVTELFTTAGLASVFGTQVQDVGLENQGPVAGSDGTLPDMEPPVGTGPSLGSPDLPGVLNFDGRLLDYSQQLITRGFENPGLGGAVSQGTEGPRDPLSPGGLPDQFSPSNPMESSSPSAAETLADAKGGAVKAGYESKLPPSGMSSSAGLEVETHEARASAGIGAGATSGGGVGAGGSVGASGEAASVGGPVSAESGVEVESTGGATDTKEGATKGYGGDPSGYGGDVAGGTPNDLPGEHVVRVMEGLSLGVSARDLVWNPDVEAAGSGGGSEVHQLAGSYGPGGMPEEGAGSTGSPTSSAPVVDKDVFVTDPPLTEDFSKNPGDSGQ
jgi:hypothetical protein